MAPDQDHLYRLRNRPFAEKLVDLGFKNITIALASVVAVVLFAILIVVFQGSLESMGRYGLELSLIHI